MNKFIVYLLLAFFTTQVLAVDKSVLTKDWQHTSLELYLTAQEAYDMKTASPEKVLFLDVRNQPEIHYTGMADTVDANIPYRFDSTDWKMKKNGIYGTFKKPKNPDFTTAVETLLQTRKLTKDDPVIIMCTSGSRAPFAAKVLIKEGFTKVYTQIEGFEGKRAKTGPRKGERIVSGWKNVGLPWSYIYYQKKCTLILILNTPNLKAKHLKSISPLRQCQ